MDYVFTCNANFYQDCRDLGNARYVTYLCDHPAQHRDRLKKLDEDAVVFVCDLLYIPYIRKYDVVFTGSYYEPKELYEKNYRAISGSPETVCTADDTGDGRTVVADN